MAGNCWPLQEVNLRRAIFSVWSYSFNMTVVKGISRKVPWEKMDHVLRPAGCFKPPVGHGLLRAVPEKSAGGHQIDPKAVPLWQRPSFWLSHTDRLRVGQLLGECSSPNLDAFVRKREITGCHLEAVIIPWVCVRGWESNDLQKKSCWPPWCPGHCWIWLGWRCTSPEGHPQSFGG